MNIIFRAILIGSIVGLVLGPLFHLVPAINGLIPDNLKIPIIGGIAGAATVLYKPKAKTPKDHPLR